MTMKTFEITHSYPRRFPWLGLAIVAALAMNSLGSFHSARAEAPAAVPSVAAANSAPDSDAEKTEQLKTILKFRGEHDHPIVPIAFFVFLLTLILGRHALRERTHRQRLELLRVMVEKGQAVPEAVVTEILSGDGGRGCGHGWHGRDGGYRAARNSYAFPFIGIALIAVSLLSSGGASHHHGILVAGIVFLGLGIGSIMARRNFPSN